MEITAISEDRTLPSIEAEKHEGEPKDTEKERVREKLIKESIEGTSLALVNQDSEFIPPVLGVTFLGTSHGFDPKGN